MDQDYSYTYSWDNVYCYPNSDILKNKLNIKDKNNLNIAERELTSLRYIRKKGGFTMNTAFLCCLSLFTMVLNKLMQNVIIYYKF